MSELASAPPSVLARARPIGVLLVNLGTPDSTSTSDVRRYLREFLSDPRVIDLPALGRWLLLNLIILPFRPRKSAHAYAQIWTSEGSPLLVHGRALAAGVAAALGERFRVELGMRYGRPSIADALGRLMAADVERVVVLPLFPQYAAASTGSALERVLDLAGGAWNVPALETINDFYDHAGFIASFAEVSRPVLSTLRPDHVLFSYHGVPERHVTKGDPTGAHCLASATCCEAITARNRSCYRAQCYASTRALARALDLGPERHSVSFQSRLGRTPWIRPYTDEVLPELARRGVRRLAVICPAFVADCLETLEEIALRGQAEWRSLGGEEFALVPSLNSHPAWVATVADMVRQRARLPVLP